MIHETSDRRVRKRTERADAFRGAALALIESDGLDGLTLPKLATAADAAVGAVYRYFPSKEALFVDLQCSLLLDLTRWLEALDRAVVERLGRVKAPVAALARVIAAGRLYGRLPHLIPGRFDLIAKAVGDPRALIPTELAGPVLQAAVPLFEHLARLLTLCDEANSLTTKEAPTQAVVFWAGLHGVVQLEKLERATGMLHNETLRNVLVRSLLIGWGAEAKVVAQAERHAARLFETDDLLTAIVGGPS